MTIMMRLSTISKVTVWMRPFMRRVRIMAITIITTITIKKDKLSKIAIERSSKRAKITTTIIIYHQTTLSITHLTTLYSW